MNALLIALVLTGQQCQVVNGRQVCPSPRQAVAQQDRSQGVVVRIESIISATRTGWGSGALVAADGQRGYVLTNRHVVRDARRLIVHRSGTRYEGTVIRIAADGDLAAISIPLSIAPWSITVATSRAETGWLLGYDGKTGQFHSHSGRFTSADGPNESYAYHTHEGESGSPIINSRGELTGIAWGTRSGGVIESPAVGLVKLRAFLASETCFRFFRRSPKQINVNINGGGGVDPIPAVPTPPEPIVTPTPLVPAPVAPSVPVSPAPVVVAGPQGPMGPQGPAGVTPNLAAIEARIVALENQVVAVALKQPDGTQTPAKIFRPQVDAKTGARATGILIDLNPQVPPTPTK